jgi:hypothetical protein
MFIEGGRASRRGRTLIYYDDDVLVLALVLVLAQN